MTTPTDPLVRDWASKEEADAWDLWFREKVTASLMDPRPMVTHEQAMERTRQTIAQIAARKDRAAASENDSTSQARLGPGQEK